MQNKPGLAGLLTRDKTAIRPPEVKYAHELLLLGLFAVVFVIMSLISPKFLTVLNLTSMVRNFIEYGLIALAMTFIIISGNIDLSVGSIVALVSVSIAMVNNATGSLGAGLAAGVAVGLACGAVNGLLVGYARVPAFVATLATQFIFHGLALGISHAESITGFPQGFSFIGIGKILGLPTQLWIFLVCAVIFSFVLNKTKFGRYIRAIGFNPESAYYSGINVSRVLLADYLVAGLMSTLAAIVLVSRVASARATFGTGMDTIAITAVVLGGTSIAGGYGSIRGTIVALFLTGIIKNGLTLARVPSEVSTVILGALLLVSIIFSGNAKSWLNIVKVRKGKQ